MQAWIPLASDFIFSSHTIRTYWSVVEEDAVGRVAAGEELDGEVGLVAELERRVPRPPLAPEAPSRLLTPRALVPPRALAPVGEEH